MRTTLPPARPSQAPATGVVSTAPRRSSRGPRKFHFLRNSKAIAGMVILALFFLIAIIGPWIATRTP